MKNICMLLISAIMLLFYVSCEKEKDNFDFVNHQRIFFQYEYINHAWGHTHTGFIIDSTGSVFCYNNPENWVFIQDSTGLISASDFNNNLNNTDSLCYTIKLDELKSKVLLIADAAEGDISEPVNEMFDAGVAEFSAFLFNEESRIYEKVLLKVTGNFRIENSSSEAMELYEWLNSIHNSIYYSE